jgi:hypothetical protein
MLWSEKEGLREVRQEIQSDGMDDALRTGLRNALHIAFLGKIAEHRAIGGAGIFSRYRPALTGLWHDCLKWPIHELPTSSGKVVSLLMRHMRLCDWRDVYDIVHYCVHHLPAPEAEQLAAVANRVLEREKSAWHFVGPDLVRRIADTEIKAIEDAWADSQPFREVHQQLRTAVAEFSSRDQPNYAHCIKEAISAVETLARLIVGDPDTSLGKALDAIRQSRKPDVHPALLGAIDKLFGYASNKGLVRHGAKPGEEGEVTMAEAQLMLVACHAVVSFLIARGQEDKVLPSG